MWARHWEINRARAVLSDSKKPYKLTKRLRTAWINYLQWKKIIYGTNHGQKKKKNSLKDYTSFHFSAFRPFFPVSWGPGGNDVSSKAFCKAEFSLPVLCSPWEQISFSSSAQLLIMPAGDRSTSLRIACHHLCCFRKTHIHRSQMLASIVYRVKKGIQIEDSEISIMRPLKQFLKAIFSKYRHPRIERQPRPFRILHLASWSLKVHLVLHLNLDFYSKIQSFDEIISN